MVCVLVDGRISAKCLSGLERRGFFPILLPRHENLPEAISSHPDSLCFYCRGELFVPAEYCDSAAYVFSDIREYAPNVKIHFTPDTLGGKYPEDAKMNAKLFGNRLLANKKTLSPSILAASASAGLEIIDTRQGYPACTTLALGESAALTADSGIKNALTQSGINVILTENGGISLPPYGYGFIGGATGVYKNEVFFIGDFKRHPNHDMIETALSENGFTPVSLSDEPLSDLGGLIFLS